MHPDWLLLETSGPASLADSRVKPTRCIRIYLGYSRRNDGEYDEISEELDSVPPSSVPSHS